MLAWTQLIEPGPALLLIVSAVLASHTARAAPAFNDEQSSTEIEYYPVADATGCYYDFQHYNEGDRIITNEPCLNCTCHNKMLMCYLKVCPYTKAIGANCKVEKRPDQCCSVITCPDVSVPVHLLTSTTPSTEVGHLNGNGCSIDGLFYSDGARVPANPSNPCELCYCIRNKTACVMQECTLNIEGCRPVYQEGVCCPVRYNCEHEQNLLETSTTPLLTTTTTTTTTLAPTTASPSDCIYNNEVYGDGALIKKDVPCEQCYCMKGDVVCAVQECGPTPLDKVNCTALPVREGQCCPDTYDCEHIVEEDLTTIASMEFTTLPPEVITETEQKQATTLRPESAILEDKTKLEEAGVTQPQPPSTEKTEEGTEEIQQVTEEVVKVEQPEEQATSAKPALTETSEKAAAEEETVTQEIGQITEKPEIDTEIHTEQEAPAATESPIEAITARVTEILETVTARVSEIVGGFTSAVSEEASEEPETTKEPTKVETWFPTHPSEHEQTEEPAVTEEGKLEDHTEKEPAGEETEKPDVNITTESGEKGVEETQAPEHPEAGITEKQPSSTDVPAVTSEEIKPTPGTEQQTEHPEAEEPGEDIHEVSHDEISPEEEEESHTLSSEEAEISHEQVTEEIHVPAPEETEKPHEGAEVTEESLKPAYEETEKPQEEPKATEHPTQDETQTPASEEVEKLHPQEATEQPSHVPLPEEEYKPKPEVQTTQTEEELVTVTAQYPSEPAAITTESQPQVTEVTKEGAKDAAGEQPQECKEGDCVPSATELPKEVEVVEEEIKPEKCTEQGCALPEPAGTAPPSCKEGECKEVEEKCDEHGCAQVTEKVVPEQEPEAPTEKSEVSKEEVTTERQASVTVPELHATISEGPEVTKVEGKPEEPHIEEGVTKATEHPKLAETEAPAAITEAPATITPEKEEESKTESEEMIVVTEIPSKETGLPESMDHVRPETTEKPEVLSTIAQETEQATVEPQPTISEKTQEIEAPAHATTTPPKETTKLEHEASAVPESPVAETTESGYTEQEVTSVPESAEKSTPETHIQRVTERPKESFTAEPEATIPQVSQTEQPTGFEEGSGAAEILPEEHATEKAGEETTEKSAEITTVEGQHKIETATKPEHATPQEEEKVTTAEPSASPKQTGSPATGEEVTEVSDTKAGEESTEVPETATSGEEPEFSKDTISPFSTSESSVEEIKPVHDCEDESCAQEEEEKEITHVPETVTQAGEPSQTPEEVEKEGVKPAEEVAETSVPETVTEGSSEAPKEAASPVSPEESTETAVEEVTIVRDCTEGESCEPHEGEKEGEITQHPETSTSAEVSPSAPEKESTESNIISEGPISGECLPGQPCATVHPDTTESNEIPEAPKESSGAHEETEITQSQEDKETTTESNAIPEVPASPEECDSKEGDCVPVEHVPSEHVVTEEITTEIEKHEGSGQEPHIEDRVKPEIGITASPEAVEPEAEVTESVKETEKPEQPAVTKIPAAYENEISPEEDVTSHPVVGVTSQPQATEKPVEEVTSSVDVEAVTRIPGEDITDEPERGIPGEGSCLVDGQTYKNNTAVPPINKCQTGCKCVSSILQCESINCDAPPADMANCMPIFQHTDSCCPTYSCTPFESSSIASDSHMMETTTARQIEEKHSPAVTEEPAVTVAEEHTTKLTEEKVTEHIPVSEEATSAPEVSGKTTIPEVVAETPKPDVSTDTPKPEITAETAKPEITAETAIPEVSSETAKPEVSVEGIKPELAEETTKPEVEEETPTPEVEAETSKPLVHEEAIGPEVASKATSSQPEQITIIAETSTARSDSHTERESEATEGIAHVPAETGTELPETSPGDNEIEPSHEKGEPEEKPVTTSVELEHATPQPQEEISEVTTTVYPKEETSTEHVDAVERVKPVEHIPEEATGLPEVPSEKATQSPEEIASISDAEEAVTVPEFGDKDLGKEPSQATVEPEVSLGEVTTEGQVEIVTEGDALKEPGVKQPPIESLGPAVETSKPTEEPEVTEKAPGEQTPSAEEEVSPEHPEIVTTVSAESVTEGAKPETESSSETTSKSVEVATPESVSQVGPEEGVSGVETVQPIDHVSSEATTSVPEEEVKIGITEMASEKPIEQVPSEITTVQPIGQVPSEATTSAPEEESKGEVTEVTPEHVPVTEAEEIEPVKGEEEGKTTAKPEKPEGYEGATEVTAPAVVPGSSVESITERISSTISEEVVPAEVVTITPETAEVTEAEKEAEKPEPETHEVTEVEKEAEKPEPETPEVTEGEKEAEKPEPETPEVTETEEEAEKPEPETPEVTETEKEAEKTEPETPEVTETEKEAEKPEPETPEVTETEKEAEKPEPETPEVSETEKEAEKPEPETPEVTETEKEAEKTEPETPEVTETEKEAEKPKPETPEVTEAENEAEKPEPETPEVTESVPQETQQPEVGAAITSKPLETGEAATEKAQENATEAVFTSAEIVTQGPIERTNVSLTDEKVPFTSVPEVESSTKPKVAGELSTSMPLSSEAAETQPTTTTTTTTPQPPTTTPQPPTTQLPQVHGEPEVPELPDYVPQEDEYEDEEQGPIGPGTCRYGGKVYLSAQQIPRDDPCDFCFCFRSDIICLQQSCPPPIPRCHEEPIRGFCCPRYECPVSMATAVNVTTSTTTTTTTLPPHFLSHAYKGRAAKTGCQIRGQAYKVGQPIPAASGPCLHCTCGGDGQMKCDPKACSPEPMMRKMLEAVSRRRR